MARLLDALRAMGDRWYTKVGESMRADLTWFEEFAAVWNGRAIITTGPPARCIQVDACLTGVGATDGVLAYAARVAPDHDPIHNITEIEAANVVIALHTFISEADAGTRIQVQCDNIPAVQAFTYGRAQNPILAECARAAWMVEALFNVKLCFIHLPGTQNRTADALSRAHVSPAYHSLAAEFIESHKLTVVRPCTYVLSFLTPSIKTRSGVRLASDPGGGQTIGGQGTRHHEGPPGGRQGARHLSPPLQDGSHAHDRDGRVRLDRASTGERGFTGDGQEQGVGSARLHPFGGRFPPGLRPYQGVQGDGCGSKDEGVPPSEEGARTTVTPEGRHRRTATGPQRADGQGGSAPYLLRCVAPVGGRPIHHGHIRPLSSPHKGRYFGARPAPCGYQMGQEPPKLQSGESSDSRQNWRSAHMSSDSAREGLGCKPRYATNGPSICVQRIAPPDTHITHQGSMDSKTQRAGGRSVGLHAPQPEEGTSHHSVRGGLHRTRGSAPWGLEVDSIPDIYYNRCTREDLKSTD